MNELKWHKRFLTFAEHVAGWSKDPSTKVGCVIVDNLNQVVSLGYNGFPRGVPDRMEWLDDRREKYPRVVHAEANAILQAGHNARGRTLYCWPLAPCCECAKLAIQAGIALIVYPEATTSRPEWQMSQQMAREMFASAGVEILPL